MFGILHISLLVLRSFLSIIQTRHAAFANLAFLPFVWISYLEIEDDGPYQP